MAQFIQANQLSPVQGSAGNQTPIQRQGPTIAESVAQVGSTLDTLGSIYSENKAKSIVDEELQNIDHARGIAEEGQFAPGDAVPPSVKLDQKQWDILAAGVASGEMSREKARLIASSRLRTRIAEEPFFADRMRKAASGVLGFNIESEGAKQYFASFPTAASLASGGGNDVLSAYAEQADAWVALDIIEDRQAGMQYLAKIDMMEAQNKTAEIQAAAGIRNANDMANTLITNHNSIAWGAFLGEMKSVEASTGQPVKPEEFSRKLRNGKQLFKERFDNSWVEAGGDINSSEYNRHLERLNSEYAEMEEFVNEYGIDNVLELKIERQEQLFDAMGQRMFPQLTMITRTFGQQVTSDLINLAATNPTKRDLIMSQNPELKRAFDLMNQDPKEFSNKLMGVSTKLLNGEELDEGDTPWLDHVAGSLHRDGSQETKGVTIRSLADQGLDWKGLSLLSESRAYLEPEVNRTYFKRQYENGMPAAVQQLAVELQATPGINATVDDEGNVVVSTDIAGGAMPQQGTAGITTNPQEVQAQIVAFNRSKQLAEKINLFTKGMKRGYDQVVGKSREQHTIDLRNMLTQEKTNVQQGAINQLQTEFNTRVDNGDIEAAKSSYESLQRLNPELYSDSWEEVLNQAEELARQELAGGQ